MTYRPSDGRVERQLYKPFGEVRYSDGLDTDKGFTGQRLDTSTGLMFYNARYYDPVIGRFISPDTIVPDPANPQDLNRYSYVRNNPLIYTDPTGHDPDESYAKPANVSAANIRHMERWAAELGRRNRRVYELADAMRSSDSVDPNLASELHAAMKASDEAFRKWANVGLRYGEILPGHYHTSFLTPKWGVEAGLALGPVGGSIGWDSTEGRSMSAEVGLGVSLGPYFDDAVLGDYFVAPSPSIRPSWEGCFFICIGYERTLDASTGEEKDARWNLSVKLAVGVFGASSGTDGSSGYFEDASVAKRAKYLVDQVGAPPPQEWYP